VPVNDVRGRRINNHRTNARFTWEPSNGALDDNTTAQQLCVEN
jgi:hypothetical protein